MGLWNARARRSAPEGRMMAPRVVLLSVFLNRHRPRAWRPILRRDACAYCGAPRAGTVDHIRPRRRTSRRFPWAGGTNAIGNLTGACAACNGTKADRPLLHFLIQRQDDRPDGHRAVTIGTSRIVSKHAASHRIASTAAGLG